MARIRKANKNSNMMITRSQAVSGMPIATITLNIDGEETTVTHVIPWGFIDENGYLRGAYDDGIGYLTDVADPIEFNAPGTETLNFLLLPEKVIEFCIVQGTVTSATGGAEYNEAESQEAGCTVYDISGDCTFNIHTAGH